MASVRLQASLIVAALALCGCGDDDGTEADGGAGDGAAADGAADADLPPDRSCETADDCVSGWSCVDAVCACDAVTESCNTADDDCDGRVDEGRGAEVGCDSLQACTDGACACAPENLCGGECVDVMNDRDNCGTCGTACEVTEACLNGLCCEANNLGVDVLFVVDNSHSMAEEQASLAEQFPRMVRALITGDVDGDGVLDFPAAADLHLGVVTSDMGTGGHSLPGCSEPMFGDDGILRTEGNTAVEGCAATYPPFVSFNPSEGDTVDQAASDFACVAQVGTEGCGIEQHFEASLKALVPSGSGVTFFGDTTGHGDAANAGFLRADSVLAVVVVADEDDCSVSDPDLFNPSSETYTEPLNLRCATYAEEALHPVSRYVDGLRALRSDHPERFVFAAVVGVPPDLVADPSSIDYDAILADDRMQEVEDTENPGRLRFSCEVEGRGQAFPPRRLVQAARALAPASVVQSICQADFGPAMGAIVEGIAVPLAEACLL